MKITYPSCIYAVYITVGKNRKEQVREREPFNINKLPTTGIRFVGYVRIRKSGGENYV